MLLLKKFSDYLKNKDLDIVNCELLTNPTAIDKVRSLSFKVTIKAEDLEKASVASIWPFRVVIRKFVNFRRREVDEFASNDQNVAGVRRLGHTSLTRDWIFMVWPRAVLSWRLLLLAVGFSKNLYNTLFSHLLLGWYPLWGATHPQRHL